MIFSDAELRCKNTLYFVIYLHITKKKILNSFFAILYLCRLFQIYMESFIELGYLGLFIISFLASTIIPLSPDLVLGALVAFEYDVWKCIFIATAGNFLGGLTTYGLGYLGKWEWIEKLFKKSKADIEKFQHKVHKLGIFAAAFVWLPFVGDVVALSLGFLRFNPTPVAIMMLIGRFARFTVVGLSVSHFF